MRRIKLLEYSPTKLRFLTTTAMAESVFGVNKMASSKWSGRKRKVVNILNHKEHNSATYPDVNMRSFKTDQPVLLDFSPKENRTAPVKAYLGKNTELKEFQKEHFMSDGENADLSMYENNCFLFRNFNFFQKYMRIFCKKYLSDFRRQRTLSYHFILCIGYKFQKSSTSKNKTMKFMKLCNISNLTTFF